MKIKNVLALLLLLTVAAGILSPGAAGETEQGRFVIVVVDRITIRDLAAGPLPLLHGLFSKGALGLMNSNVPGDRISSNTYLSVGAGARVKGGEETAGFGFNAAENWMEEPARALYRRWIGGTAGEGEIIYLGFPEAARENEKLNYTYGFGSLGDSLHKAGIKTAVIGNADYDDEIRRHAVALAADSRAKVDTGDVGQRCYMQDPSSIGGKRTDFDYLIKKYRDIKDNARYIVIETGDTARIAEGSWLARPTVAAREKGKALARVAKFLESLVEDMDLSRDRLLVVTPTPDKKAYESNDSLTPIFLAGKGVTPGVLTSPGTKREGVITNIDIVPTVAAFFGVPTPYYLAGQPMYGVARENALTFLETANQEMLVVYNARPPLVKGFVGGLIVLLLVALFYIYFKDKKPRFIKMLLVAVSVIPVAFLYLGLFPQQLVFLTVVEAIILTVAGTFLALYAGRRRELDPFIIVAIFTAGSIVVDVLLGAPMMKQSVLGYDPIAGARFYGIGNEYMGILIGAAIIGITAWLSRQNINLGIKLWPLALVFAFIIFVIAAPDLGTNVGGTIAAVIGFGVVYFRLSNIKLTKVSILLIATAAVAIIGGFISFDLFRGGAEQSHIGRTAVLIKQGGLQEVFDIILRKASMNIRLIKYTIWSRVFLTSIGVLAVLFYRPIGIMGKVRDHYRALFHGFVGVNVGSIAALIFNDSGIVAAATMMVYPVSTLLYLLIQERREDGRQL